MENFKVYVTRVSNMTSIARSPDCNLSNPTEMSHVSMLHSDSFEIGRSKTCKFSATSSIFPDQNLAAINGSENCS